MGSWAGGVRARGDLAAGSVRVRWAGRMGVAVHGFARQWRKGGRSSRSSLLLSGVQNMANADGLGALPGPSAVKTMYPSAVKTMYPSLRPHPSLRPPLPCSLLVWLLCPAPSLVWCGAGAPCCVACGRRPSGGSRQATAAPRRTAPSSRAPLRPSRAARAAWGAAAPPPSTPRSTRRTSCPKRCAAVQAYNTAGSQDVRQYSSAVPHAFGRGQVTGGRAGRAGRGWGWQGLLLHLLLQLCLAPLMS